MAGKSTDLPFLIVDITGCDLWPRDKVAGLQVVINNLSLQFR